MIAPPHHQQQDNMTVKDKHLTENLDEILNRSMADLRKGQIYASKLFGVTLLLYDGR
jgi:hypothetical protein